MLDLDPTLRKLSRLLKTASYDDSFYTEVSEHNFGPCDGGCLIIASTLSDLLTLAPLGGGFKDGIVHHAFVWFDGYLIDGDGISTVESMTRRWQKREGVLLTWEETTFDVLQKDCHWDDEAAVAAEEYYRRVLDSWL